MTSKATSIAELLDHPKDTPAIVKADGSITTFGKLRDRLGQIHGQLESGAVPRGRIIAMSPVGDEGCENFLACMTYGGVAPLNQALTSSDLDYYLGRIEPAAVLITSEQAELAAAAHRADIPTVHVRAGTDTPSTASPQLDSPPGSGLILHTSGTTGTPKTVQLSDENVLHSARSVAAALKLHPNDRGVIMMPLYHIHGLVAGLLAPLSVGGSVAVMRQFDPRAAVERIAEGDITWYTAVPTMHQAIVAQPPQPSSLRVVRSSSSALPPAALAALEERFNAPVIEAYGMTEAAHQICSNPLPPRIRKRGSVGLPSGAQVRVHPTSDPGSEHDDEKPDSRGPGTVGDVEIRGRGVINAYRGETPHNSGITEDGWFSTGDEGYLDTDGYLFLAGRSKEMINRGGATIAPSEVEAELASHPDVIDQAVFAVTHESLGEDVAAVVVLRPDATAQPEDIRDHVRRRLTYFKVPRRIVAIDKIPLGPTGKVQRTKLAELLGVTQPTQEATQPAPARDELDEVLLDLMRTALSSESAHLLGITDDYLSLGGDSLGATRLAAIISDRTGVTIAPTEVLQLGTVQGLADQIARRAQDRR